LTIADPAQVKASLASHRACSPASRAIAPRAITFLSKQNSVWKLMVVMAIGMSSHKLEGIGSFNRAPLTSFRDKETIDEEKS
jgi:hypothetical protein